MKSTLPNKKLAPRLALVMAATGCLFLGVPLARATVSFLGVASGDATSSDAVVWTRAIDSTAPTSSTTLTLRISTDPTLTTGVTSVPGLATDTAHDYTCKLAVSNLSSGTVYYYQFVGSGGELSNIGKFKTAPAPNAATALHFAFSGDYDGLMRPYTLGNNFTANNFDFFMNIGDTIYETASTGSAAVTASGSFGAGLPTNTTGANPSTLYSDYTRKYREQFIAINSGGQNCLQDFFAAQGNYTLLDNHELGNKQYMHGGAAAGGQVGSSSTGAGVDPAVTSNDVNTSGTFMNKTPGFTSLIGAFTDYQPIKNRGTITASSDPRTDGTQQLYMSQQWGKHSILINTDTRSYRDIRLRTSGNTDDNGARADNTGRTYFGATQLAWIQQTLLDAQNAGTTWKFVAISDPIDQIGPIGGALSGTLTSVNSDGGKSLIGGYRAERNALLKFIADHGIRNVVFLTTDDHQNRINEILYSPTGVTGPGSAGASGMTTAQIQALYKPVPYCFEIVDGPFGATGPETITDHSFSNISAIAADLASHQSAAGVDPIGLSPTYPGLHNVVREGHSTADTDRSPVDFYSPDTFNYNTIDVSADGKTLTVKSIGVNSYAQNNRVEANTGNQAGNTPRQIFSFQVDATANPLDNIDHIVVVYQENWSFDALYGSFPGANGRANASAASLAQRDRLTGNLLSSESGTNNYNNATRTSPAQNTPPQPLNGSNAIDTSFPSSLNTLVPYNVANFIPATTTTGDIVHKYWQEQFQIMGALTNDTDLVNNSGFVTWSDNPGLVMSYYDATNLPEGLLAQQYTMCDNFFHSAFGGSFLNHQFLIAAAAPVYANMPTSNNGAIAYLDGTGLFAVNTSGSSSGKVIRDGSITPVAGDSLTGLTINGATNQSATVGSSAPPSDVIFQSGGHFDKHYVVNTTFTANMCPTTSTFGAVSLMPSLNNTNPAGAEYTQNIGDLLDNAGVSWKWYSGGWNDALDSSKSNPSHLGTAGTTVNPLFQWHHQPFAYFEKSKPFDAAQSNGRNPYATAHLQDEANLYTDIMNNTLPAVSFVKFLGPDNEHPGYASLQQGQQHVADLITKLQANPTLWARTLVIVTYDEHGGRWDHVTPPSRDIWGPGVRVPCILISPLAKKGYVDHVQRDTSSVLSTIEKRFGLPALNARDAAAPTFADLLTTQQTQISRSGFTLNRTTQRFVQTVTVTNTGSIDILGPISVALDGLSTNTTLSNKSGNTANNAPTGSPYITLTSVSKLAAGASTTVQLQFTVPASGSITYTPRVITGTYAP